MRFGHTFVALLILATGCGSFGAPGNDDAKPDNPSHPDAPPTDPGVAGTPTDKQLTEEFGVFVAASGSLNADGSRKRPFGTIQAGLARAKEQGKRVYVCGETFKEAVTLERGISMFGGYDCSAPTWKRGDRRTRIESPSSPALKAVGIDLATRFEGFVVIAPNGTSASPTSVGLHAVKAPALTIASSSIIAGRGADGAAGAEGMQLTFSQTAPGQGADEWIQGDSPSQPDNVGGAGAVGSCGGAPGIAGGSGGRGGKSGEFLSDRCRPRRIGGMDVSSCSLVALGAASYVWYNEKFVGLPVVGPTGVVFERERKPGAKSGPGEPGAGAPASAGVDGVSASAPGRFSEEGFVAADGVNGTNGTPGQGGAGGRARDDMGRYAPGPDLAGHPAEGPGGGAGGCPGMAGAAGKGGGASVGAFVVDSVGLVFDATEITAGDAGNGGQGTFGSNATAGGPPALPHPGAGAAAPGTPGGRAGVSGSGGGGTSVGIAHHGGAPTLVNKSAVSFGKPGAGVIQAQAADAVTGETKTLPASVDGVAKDMIDF